MSPQSLLVIGGGPGGYAAALEAARRSWDVTLIERHEIGGTCLNRGCIPSKFFLSHAKFMAKGPGSAPMTALLERKDEIVRVIRGRMEQAVKSARVHPLTGTARFLSAKRVEVELPDRTQRALEADAILLATGSSPVRPSIFPQHPAVLDSTSALNLDYVPSHLVVVGGGYIGCELACAFQGFGAKVTIIERESRLLPTQPEFEATAAILQRLFEKRGMTVWLNTQVESVEALEERRLRVRASNGETFEANAVLLALGRAPNLGDLGLEKAGLFLSEGRLRVNVHMQTQISNIYAIGDLVSPVPLAHVASREAEVAVAHMAGEKRSIDYVRMPRCVYTWPEAAAVGFSEQQAQAAGHPTRVDRYHFAGNSKALVEEESEGLWITVSDAGTRKILGAQIVGPHATELIHLVALSLKAGLRVDDVAETVFAHPTLSEGFQESMKRAALSLKSSSLKEEGL